MVNRRKILFPIICIIIIALLLISLVYILTLLSPHTTVEDEIGSGSSGEAYEARIIPVNNKSTLYDLVHKYIRRFERENKTFIVHEFLIGDYYKYVEYYVVSTDLKPLKDFLGAHFFRYISYTCPQTPNHTILCDVRGYYNVYTKELLVEVIAPNDWYSIIMGSIRPVSVLYLSNDSFVLISLEIYSKEYTFIIGRSVGANENFSEYIINNREYLGRINRSIYNLVKDIVDKWKVMIRVRNIGLQTYPVLYMTYKPIADEYRKELLLRIGAYIDKAFIDNVFGDRISVRISNILVHKDHSLHYKP